MAEFGTLGLPTTIQLNYNTHTLSDRLNEIYKRLEALESKTNELDDDDDELDDRIEELEGKVSDLDVETLEERLELVESLGELVDKLRQVFLPKEPETEREETPDEMMLTAQQVLERKDQWVRQEAERREKIMQDGLQYFSRDLCFRIKRSVEEGRKFGVVAYLFDKKARFTDLLKQNGYTIVENPSELPEDERKELEQTWQYDEYKNRPDSCLIVRIP